MTSQWCGALRGFCCLPEQDVQQNNRFVRNLRRQDAHVMSLYRFKQMDQHTRCLHLSQYNFNKKVLLTELYEILHELHWLSFCVAFYKCYILSIVRRVWVQVPNLITRKFSVPDANIIQRERSCFIDATNRKRHWGGQRRAPRPEVCLVRRSVVPIHEHIDRTRLYGKCDEVPFHGRGVAHHWVVSSEFIPDSYSNSRRTSPYADSNRCIGNTAIVKENLHRGHDLGENLQPKGNRHSRIALTRNEKAAACVSSKIDISLTAIYVDGVTNHTGYDSCSVHQSAI